MCWRRCVDSLSTPLQTMYLRFHPVPPLVDPQCPPFSHPPSVCLPLPSPQPHSLTLSPPLSPSLCLPSPSLSPSLSLSVSADYPLTRFGFSKSFSSLIVFGVSAALHELVISIPMGTISFHAFFGMLAQVPLIFITKGDITFLNSVFLIASFLLE